MANEKRLIDGNACLHDMCKRCNIENEYCPCEPADCFIYNVLENSTTVDAVEVVHGQWINKTKEIYGMVDERNDCSNCGQIYWFACPDFNYCPNCGAKMDGAAP